MVALTVPSMAFSIGTNPWSTSPFATASSTAVIDPEGDELGWGQVGLGQQGLLREGGRRPEVGDRGRRGVHSWAG